MISRKFRITTRLFPLIRKKSNKKIETDSFRFFVSQYKMPKFSVIISKKQKFSAVDRNKIRRRTYEFIRTQTPLQMKNYNILCYYKKKHIITFDQLGQEFQYFLNKIS